MLLVLRDRNEKTQLMFASAEKPAQGFVLVTERILARRKNDGNYKGSGVKPGPFAISRLREHVCLVVELRLCINFGPVQLSLTCPIIFFFFRQSVNRKCTRKC